jgi:threonine aldolase
MAEARVGDDVYGEDPTVNELEARAAAQVGKEAGLLVSSGTQGNLVAILTHAGRGDEALVGRDAHTVSWEAGGMAVLGGVVPQTLPTDEMGRMDLGELEAAIRPEDTHLPRTRLILLENSYGARAGAAIPPDYFAAVRAIADRYDLRVHLDGARLFNAAVALNVAAEAITRHVDSVTFCLSKGLCAPVGSVLCGSASFIHEARRARKLLGGGMRQAGILAAAGLVALDGMIERLGDDHANARLLAEGLATIPGIIVAPESVQTNMVFFSLADDVPLTVEDVIERLAKENICIGDHGPREFRAVTHYWIGPDEVAHFVDRLRAVLHG